MVIPGMHSPYSTNFLVICHAGFLAIPDKNKLGIAAT